MCDNICRSEKKYALGAVPYFPPPPVVKAYPCHAVEVDTPIYEPLVKPVIKNIVQETTINVPKIEYRENVVEVPKVEYRPYPVVKDVETPIYQDKYTYKDVPVPQKQYRIKPIYKTVDVPEVEYVDKYVKKKYKRFKYVPKEVQIPFRPKKEIYTEVPVPRYIPQHMESVMQPDPLAAPAPLVYHGELPTYAAYTENPIGAINPVVTVKEPKQNKCCLSSLFCKKENKYEVVPPVIQPRLPLVDLENNLYNPPPHMTPYYPPSPLVAPYDAIGYSHPFIVEEEENDLCATIIETTANVLAASGVALILAGKLTFDGISYLMKLSNKSKSKNEARGRADEIEDSQMSESKISVSGSPSTYSLESSITTVEAV